MSVAERVSTERVEKIGLQSVGYQVRLENKQVKAHSKYQYAYKCVPTRVVQVHYAIPENIHTSLQKGYSEVSLEAGNRQKSPSTLSEFASDCHLLCLYFHSKY